MAKLKVFQNTDLRCNKYYLLTSWEERRNWYYVSKRLGLLHRSILTVKSLKRTLYFLPKTTLIYPYTPLYDVNVTSIYSNTRTHTLIFYIRQIYILISSWKEGRNRCGSLHTHRFGQKSTSTPNTPF